VRIAEIMQTNLVAVSPATTVVEAAGVMKERRVGACLVMEGPELAGIFTERDLLFAFADGLDVRERPVTELMTRQVTLAPPDANVVWAALHPEDRTLVARSLAESARTLADWHQEFRVLFDNGEVHWLSGHAVPERADFGAFVRAKGFRLD